MSSILGQCPECCECPTPTLEARSRWISKSKQGYPEYAGYQSSPPKYYLTSTISGTHEERNYATAPCSGSYTYAYRSYTGSSTIGPDGSCIVNSRSVSTRDFYGTTNTYTPNCSYPVLESGMVTSSSYAYFNVSPYCDGNRYYASDDRREDLSDEYSTSALIAYATESLPAYSGAWGYGFSSRNLSSNELSYAIQESQYRFRFKVPKVGSGNYTLTWVERFTPEGGGATTDTVKTWTWDKVVPVGYNPADSATWPVSSEYTLAIPTADGTTAVACVVATCTGSAPVDPCNP